MAEKQDRNDAETNRLRVLLEEDLASSAEVEATLPAISQLKQMSVMEPTSQQTMQLIEWLAAELPTPEPRWQVILRRAWDCWPLLLLRSQSRIVKREIWAASALVMLLGTLVTLTMQGGATSDLTPLAVIAPVVAAFGVGLLYDNEIESMLELENATMASARLLLLARLTLVFGFNLLLSLAASMALALFQADVLLWPLVLSWFAPMAFLSALSFSVSVMGRDALLGSVSGLLLWGIHIIARTLPEGNPLVELFSLPGYVVSENRSLLLLLAPALVLLALWFVGWDESRIGGRRC